MSTSRSARPRDRGTATALRPVPGTATPEQYGAARSVVHHLRTHGHLAARLDPLGTEPPGDPALDPGFFGLSQEALHLVPAAALNVAIPGDTLADVLPRLRSTYCGSIAYQIEHLSSHRQRTWLRQVIESGAFEATPTPEEQKRLLIRLLRVELFEQYLRRTFLGEKQFSIEGMEMLILMLDETIAIAAEQGVKEAVLGMAHRGRLNVLAHVLRRPYASILAEFEGRPAAEVEELLPESGTGDVKYHHGARGAREITWTRDGQTSTAQIELSLMPNPSHLEFVDPVVVGRVRALQTDHTRSLAPLDRSRAMAIQIHGDAAFPGQGIVAETLNLQSLPGYSTGGSVHLIANNQVGFTTDPPDARPTAHSSDLAKGFDVPIVHVNADALEACRTAVRLAMAFRERFERDFLIDLVGYRRWGHNEGDEPRYTQPQMYERVERHPSAATLYAQWLVEAGVVSEDDVAEMKKRITATIATAHKQVREGLAEQARAPRRSKQARSEGRAAPDADLLRALNGQLLELPEGFTPHPKLFAQLQRRLKTIDEGGIDWGQAEALAFASLLVEGEPIRLTGQDSERGTFAHRHLVLHDVENGDRYCPMQHLPEAKASFEVFNSPLSENACIGFEYGYSITAPDLLDLWEAQFGDFANGAQVIIDQFISAGRAKWGQTTRLTLLLPHGYEGNGPEHSSARLERFLELAADDNLRIANATTPAQFFHLLRWQATTATRRPLVVMTPKSLLRLKDATSTLEDLADGTFQRLIDDASVQDWKEDVERLVLCSGKIFYDLERHPDRDHADTTAIARAELLYPFPKEELAAVLAGYPNLETLIWAQEEPKNMGAWRSVRHRLEGVLPPGVELRYEGRPSQAAPSEGYPKAHQDEQARIVRAALGLAPADEAPEAVLRSAVEVD